MQADIYKYRFTFINITDLLFLAQTAPHILPPSAKCCFRIQKIFFVFHQGTCEMYVPVMQSCLVIMQGSKTHTHRVMCMCLYIICYSKAIQNILCCSEKHHMSKRRFAKQQITQDYMYIYMHSSGSDTCMQLSTCTWQHTHMHTYTHVCNSQLHSYTMPKVRTWDYGKCIWPYLLQLAYLTEWKISKVQIQYL